MSKSSQENIPGFISVCLINTQSDGLYLINEHLMVWISHGLQQINVV